MAHPRTVGVPSRLISEAEFADHYAAAEFAVKSGLPCDTTVTVSWSLLGCRSDTEVQALFTKFLKCMRDWLAQRNLPVVYLYAHEVSARFGTHTHLAVYIPGGPWTPYDQRSEYRTWVRQWAKRYAKRQQQCRAPTAVEVKTRPQETVWLHWLAFSYQMKGYDKSVVVQSAPNAPNGRSVRLGDLIAYEWRDPGPVTLKFRCGHSDSLRPAQRALGCPFTPQHARDDTAWLEGFTVEKPYRQPLAKFGVATRRGLTPFRSSYEDGCRDIRGLYPPEFHRRITRLPPILPIAVPEAETDIDSLMRTLQI
ncbi:hypothetical protein GCM10007886_26070 [Methylobacterium gregans]|nr:hypothetical protein GCM10007886_26070 [Methylobacterium gregans]